MALRTLGEPIDSYDQLIGVIRARLAEVGSTCEAISDVAGLTTTHVSKLVNPKRSRVLGRMSLSVVLQVLGIKLVAIVDDEAYAPLRARLPRSTFNRWPERELRVRVDDVGGEEAVKKVPALLDVVSVPIAEPKPKPAPLVQLRPKMPGRGFAFGRGHRKASRSGASAAA